MNYYLNPNQYAVLGALAEVAGTEGATVKELCSRSQLKAASVRAALSVLTSHGLMFKRFGVELYAPTAEAVRGLKDGNIHIGSDEQIRAQSKRLGAKVRAVREKADLTRECVADIFGVPNNTYYEFERGNRQMSVQRLRRFAWAMHMPLDYFLEEVS